MSGSGGAGKAVGRGGEWERAAEGKWRAGRGQGITRVHTERGAGDVLQDGRCCNRRVSVTVVLLTKWALKL